MTAAMAMGQQQVLHKSAFLSIQMSLKHVCESVSEEQKDAALALSVHVY